MVRELCGEELLTSEFAEKAAEEAEKAASGSEQEFSEVDSCGV